MRLKQIKLAGFKSFVDPTKVPFVQQMTAIVGPNGCGKSNIIDAVRWVLGESSAKNLRGDAMTDVIFNGAASRKPVGQASVELIFEHSNNPMSPALTQHLADRSEISIRRVVNREGTNTYFLNGSKCRRKDITDIFLGTGLGPRSYAIIEQGTITRLIESKPQELRVFIEEAAGISKYKERRRDTENRIKHTRENLDRLSDIRFELGQQIEKLDQQAQAAKRFRTLKGQERTFKAELAILRHEKFLDQAKQEQEKINRRQKEIEQLVVDQIAIDNKITTIKTTNASQSEALDTLQATKVEHSSQCVRLEQTIKHAKARLHVLGQEREKHLMRHQQLNEQLQKDMSNEALHRQTVESKTPILAADEEKLSILSSQIDELKLQNRTAQENFQRKAAQAQELVAKKAELASKVEYVKANLQQFHEQKKQLQEKLNVNNNEPLTIVVEQEKRLLEQLEVLFKSKQTEHQQIKHALEQSAEAMKTIEQSETELSWRLDSLQSQIKQQQAELSQYSQNRDLAGTCELLKGNNIHADGELYNHISVDEGWTTAVNKVVGDFLHAQVINEAISDVELLEEIASSYILVKSSTAVVIAENSLATKIKGIEYFPWLVRQLNLITVADSYDEATSILASVTDEQSIICAEGVWLSPEFLTFGQQNSTEDVLGKQYRIKSMKAEVEQLQHEQTTIKQTIESTKSIHAENERKLTTVTREVENVLKQLNEARQNLALHEQTLTHQRKTLADGREQLLDTEQRIEQATEALEDLLYQQAINEEESVEDLSDLEQINRRVTDELAQKQQALIELQSSYHQHKVALETAITSQKSTELHKLRLEEQIDALDIQLQEIGFEQENLSLPLEQDELDLKREQEVLFAIDQQLDNQHKLLAGASEQIEQCDLEKKRIFNAIEAHREALNKLHINQQNYQVRAENALEGLPEHQSINQIKNNMPSDAKESLWQANLVRLAKDISLLGPINLAAIDEFEAQVERKQYLDKQDLDLNQALATLEDAIAKIDRESRAKFKTTFDQVNHDLQQLFPKVFGGGSAYLELTGEDLLETGVTIMARPPGKKNSTIHLLSGGEKALTALSLVFAIFRLNPAPFCMLDEVDAPLDDANVGRFCNLVREMSQTVQFIYISHNKIAMEMASQLTGVTMYEPGVSRMVAVDIDEAVAMAELS